MMIKFLKPINIHIYNEHTMSIQYENVQQNVFTLPNYNKMFFMLDLKIINYTKLQY